MEKKNNKDINNKKINDLVSTGNKILKILYILFIIVLIYVAGLVVKDWKILSIFGKILSVISPLFIGFFIAWLLNPLVNKLTKKGLNRTLSVILVYLALLIVIYLIFAFTLPSLGAQISEIVSAIPSILSDVKGWINNIFVKLSDLSLENLDKVKASFFLRIENFATDIQTDLPGIVVNVVSSIVSGLGTILLSFIVGVYISFDFDNFSKGFYGLLPKKSVKEVRYLVDKLSETLFSFVSGTLWISLLLFIVTYVGFAIIGLDAPLLVAFICIITNLIPYIGPYLGAAVASAIGFAESPLIGILTLVFILITQSIEGNFLQPLIMSKKMNLSPITIIISLLLFGYFFGILGMVVATPIAALLKIIYIFFDEKYHFFDFNDKKE